MLMEKETYEATMKEQKEIIKKQKTDFKKQGKRNRASGARFELKVRKKLEDVGWNVLKNPNQVYLETNEFKSAKHQYNPFRRFMSYGNGFPDFICYMYEGSAPVYNQNYRSPHDNYIHPRNLGDKKIPSEYHGIKDYTQQFPFKANYIIIGIECKSNGTLSKEEKEKCVWLLSNQIFSKIFIVSKGKKRGEINYKEFVNENTK